MSDDPKNDDDDADALAWAGDEKPVVEPVETSPPVAEVLEAPTDAALDKPQTPAALLITYGILGGIDLIYTIGWITTVVRLNGVRAAFTDPLSEIMFQFGEFLAIASPLAWFAAVFLLSRGRKPIVRLTWILIGLVTTLPWPFVLGAWA